MTNSKIKMSVQDHIETAYGFLYQADDELEEGDELQASEKLWGAASHALLAVATDRGLSDTKHSSMRRLADRLSDEQDKPDLSTWFDTAESLHANFYNGFLDEEGIRRRRGQIVSLLDWIAGLYLPPSAEELLGPAVTEEF